MAPKAFSRCSALTAIAIPNSVTSIGRNAFSGCSGLTSINIPNSVTNIEEYAFNGCTGLTSINIPNSVSILEKGVLSICQKLTSITIPTSITSIGDYAFGGCNLPVLNLLRPGEDLYITEGCSDCWAMLSAGHKAIAIPSATLLSKADAEQLSTLHSHLSTPFHMFPDRDAPGERLFLQLQQILPSLVHHQLPLGCKDFGEYFSHNRDRPLCEK